jgi:hypothetical protein
MNCPDGPCTPNPCACGYLCSDCCPATDTDSHSPVHDYTFTVRVQGVTGQEAVVIEKHLQRVADDMAMPFDPTAERYMFSIPLEGISRSQMTGLQGLVDLVVEAMQVDATFDPLAEVEKEAAAVAEGVGIPTPRSVSIPVETITGTPIVGFSTLKRSSADTLIYEPRRVSRRGSSELSRTSHAICLRDSSGRASRRRGHHWTFRTVSWTEMNAPRHAHRSSESASGRKGTKRLGNTTASDVRGQCHVPRPPVRDASCDVDTRLSRQPETRADSVRRHKRGPVSMALYSSACTQ